MVFAAVAGNEQAENPFKRSPDPCTNPIDMRTTFHGQLNFPSSFVISLPSSSQTLSRVTLLAAISLTEHAGVTEHEFAFDLPRLYSPRRSISPLPRIMIRLRLFEGHIQALPNGMISDPKRLLRPDSVLTDGSSVRVVPRLRCLLHTMCRSRRPVWADKQMAVHASTAVELNLRQRLQLPR